MASLLSFSADVSRSGYEWVPADEWNVFSIKGNDPNRERSLLPEPAPEWRVREPWNPLGNLTPKNLLRAAGPQYGPVNKTFPTDKDAALFRNFAGLDPTPNAIVGFANNWGNLFDRLAGVPFAEWEYEIRTMRFLLDLWDEVRDGKRSGMVRQHFQQDGSTVSLPFAGSLANYQPYGEAPPAVSRTVVSTTGTPLEVARRFVVIAVNSRLVALGGQLSIERVGGVDRLTIRPKSLLAAMWIQFADAISEQKAYRQCEACGRYMEMSPDENRADRKTCSNACRNRAQRRRQKLARELRASGKSLREIEAATGSDKDTIKKWLAAQEK